MNNENASPTPHLQILPNSSTVLVLGILSIFFFCISFGFISLVMGIIALVLAQQSKKLYLETPRLYTEASYKNLNTGKTCAIVGIVLSSLIVCIIILALLFGLGIAISAIPFCI
ncbi:MAG: CCC motif membrane protein [Marinifilaceae bacterium]